MSPSGTTLHWTFLYTGVFSRDDSLKNYKPAFTWKQESALRIGYVFFLLWEAAGSRSANMKQNSVQNRERNPFFLNPKVQHKPQIPPTGYWSPSFYKEIREYLAWKLVRPPKPRVVVFSIAFMFVYKAVSASRLCAGATPARHRLAIQGRTMNTSLWTHIT